MTDTLMTGARKIVTRVLAAGALLAIYAAGTLTVTTGLLTATTTSADAQYYQYYWRRGWRGHRHWRRGWRGHRHWHWRRGGWRRRCWHNGWSRRFCRW
jgi:hypothetical protein